MKIRADRHVGLLLAGVILLTFVALGATVALPAFDPTVRATTRPLAATRAHGMKVYANEGCWYCHSRYVRTTPVDSVYGAPLTARGYAAESPTMFGLERVGPDLTRVGSRYGAAADLIEYLRAPGRKAGRTSMPSYSYLSDDDLRALAAFLLSTR